MVGPVSSLGVFDTRVSSTDSGSDGFAVVTDESLKTFGPVFCNWLGCVAAALSHITQHCLNQMKAELLSMRTDPSVVPLALGSPHVVFLASSSLRARTLGPGSWSPSGSCFIHSDG